jgi:uncharacterized cupredoxin-like copper-binding protein
MNAARTLVALAVAVSSASVAACGGDDDSSSAAEKGMVVNVALGESGLTYFVRPDRTTVEAGTVTFTVTNAGELTHEFIVYSNPDDLATGDLPVDPEADEAELVEENIVGAAPYATPPIVPSDKEPGDADHRIPGGGWGAELTVDLAAGTYILLCNLPGHYSGGKQHSALTVT